MGTLIGRRPDADQFTDAQITGLAIIILGVVIAAGWFVRRKTVFLRRLFIPASVISGFLVLLLGNQVLGALTRTQGLFPASVVDVWRVIPGLMINVVFGAIMIGKTLPTLKELWGAVGTAVPSPQLVRARDRRLRPIPGQRRHRFRAGRHDRPAAPDVDRQRLRLQAARLRAVPGRRPADGAVGALDPQFGLLPFTLVSIALTGLLALWGIRRRTA